MNQWYKNGLFANKRALFPSAIWEEACAMRSY